MELVAIKDIKSGKINYYVVESLTNFERDLKILVNKNEKENYFYMFTEDYEAFLIATLSDSEEEKEFIKEYKPIKLFNLHALKEKENK